MFNDMITTNKAKEGSITFPSVFAIFSYWKWKQYCGTLGYIICNNTCSSSTREAEAGESGTNLLSEFRLPWAT